MHRLRLRASLSKSSHVTWLASTHVVSGTRFSERSEIRPRHRTDLPLASYSLTQTAKTRSGKYMTSGEGIVAKTVGGVTNIVRSLGRGIASGIAVVAMVAIYAVSSIGSYGVTALGLTGVTGLALATTAQPAEAHRYRRRRRRGRRWGGGWGPGVGLYIGPSRRRRRRRRW